MLGRGMALNSWRVIGAPVRFEALEPVRGPLRSHHFCMARFHTVSAWSSVVFPLLFGLAGTETGVRSNS